MTKWYQLKIEDALKELGTDAARGLSGSEAAVRLNRFGSNELIDRGQKSQRTQQIARELDLAETIDGE